MTQKKILVSLARFSGRKEKLKKITRYSLYDVMFYRTNLWNHSSRVSWLVKEIEPYAVRAFENEYDPRKAYAIALVHDDAEILTGDVQAGNKSKMSAEELAKIDQLEQEAIDTLAAQFPTQVGPYLYRDLLQEALDKKSLEAQVVMLGDKLDAFGETLHEIYAGNTYFVTNVVNEYGTIPTPFDYYHNYLSGFSGKYPLMKPLFSNSAWLFQSPVRVDFKTICSRSLPHTIESLSIYTDYLHYDGWKKVVLKNSSKEELMSLYIQEEGLHSA